jgi:two-component system chemotaxis sensor kinase CheA
MESAMNDAATVTQAYEQLLEFVYVSPYALTRFSESGAIDMMNSMGANLLLDFAPSPELTNLFEILDVVDPGVRALVKDYTEERGPICEGRRLEIPAFGGGDPVILSLNIIKLGAGWYMAAFGDVSKLEAAHRAQRFLLENVSDGLIAVSATGEMSDQCSATLARWIGAPTAGEKIWSYIASRNPAFAATLQLGWEAMNEDVLPLELYLDQLPGRLDVDGLPLGVSYQPLMAGGKLTHVLVVMRDLTAQIERERLDAEQRELMSAVSRLSTDREGFRNFFEEASKLVQTLVATETAGQLQTARLVHTLKGNSAIFGITSIAAMCHEFEDHLQAGADTLANEERARLAERWSQLSDRFGALIGDTSSNTLSITRMEHGRVLQMLRNNTPRKELIARVESLALAPMQPQLLRFKDQTEQLAARLGKAPVELRVSARGIRHHAERFAPFWSSFVHALRNAVDHGIETPEERALAAKSPTATVELTAVENATDMVLTLRDDGRGIDWGKVAAKAHAAGLPCSTQDDLKNAIFADGVSSRDEVSDTSGRGVGMGALKEACEKLGGRIAIDSEANRGTAFRFSFPIQVLRRLSLLPPMLPEDAADDDEAAA